MGSKGSSAGLGSKLQSDFTNKKKIWTTRTHTHTHIYIHKPLLTNQICEFGSVSTTVYNMQIQHMIVAWILLPHGLSVFPESSCEVLFLYLHNHHSSCSRTFTSHVSSQRNHTHTPLTKKIATTMFHWQPHQSLGLVRFSFFIAINKP